MATKTIQELTATRIATKEILDLTLAIAKSDKERIAIKKGGAKLDEITNKKLKESLTEQHKKYKENVEILKEINDQVKEIRDVHKEDVDNLIQQEKGLKSLTGLQQSLVKFEREKLRAYAAQNVELNSVGEIIKGSETPVISYAGN